MNTQKKTKGFTIIEVVLVLAIAGLIFLMVFLALPALQRSQRDTQRKTDLSRAQTAINNYQSNNKGAIPASSNATLQSFVNKYIVTNSGDTFVDPLGAGSGNNAATTYVLTVNNANLGGSFTLATQNIIYYSASRTCGVDGALVTASSKKVALSMYLEGGGVTCVSN